MIGWCDLINWAAKRNDMNDWMAKKMMIWTA
jgi:hypothetical protein